jgi:alpha-N-arabinofuranosidase
MATYPGGPPVTATAEDVSFKVSSRPRHDGRIDPKLFGNFIELLDDLAPGMWVELLNDRGFEGVVPAARWVYYDGSETICDRAWEKGEDWSVETEGAFNGPRCARISSLDDRWGGLAQSGLSVKAGEVYRVSIWLRAEGDVRAQAVLKARNPSGGLDDLTVIDLEKPTNRWARVSGELRPRGTTDRAIFEVRAKGEGSLFVDKVSLMPARNLRGWRV